MTNDQAKIFVAQRVRPQATRGRAFLAMAASDGANWALGYADFFAPGGVPANSTFVEGRTDVPHEVTATHVAQYMDTMSRINAALTPADKALLEILCVTPLIVGD